VYFKNLKVKSSLINLSQFKADGNEMFGDVPKSVWEKYCEADNNNLCKWALRSLLIDDGENIVLIDTGFGDFDKQLLDFYCVDDYRPIDKILEEAGYSCDQITHVLHTHLHVDHCGGSFIKKTENQFVPVFKNAKYIVSNQQLKAALNPSNFEKESFQPQAIQAFSKHDNLQLIESDCFLFPWLELKLYHGHTHGLIIPLIHLPDRIIAFVGDLIPSVAHIVLQSTMNYDVDKELSFIEQTAFLEKAFINNYYLFFQHDFYNECCTLKKENSRFVPAEIIKL
jgi:glyoxylase-like metal-dependent hydrolase (beta-lactamase superfamily II)